jgi:hypothetical protein
MLVKIQDLTGSALDYAVAAVQGLEDGHDGNEFVWVKGNPFSQQFMPSSDWSQGGPILQAQNITLERNVKTSGCSVVGFYDWVATHPRNYGGLFRYSSRAATPLIAAMRCYVSAHSKTKTVEIPDKLMEMQNAE